MLIIFAHFRLPLKFALEQKLHAFQFFPVAAVNTRKIAPMPNLDLCCDEMRKRSISQTFTSFEVLLPFFHGKLSSHAVATSVHMNFSSWKTCHFSILGNKM